MSAGMTSGTVSQRSGQGTSTRAGRAPVSLSRGTLFTAAFMLAVMFLRASSIPTGLSHRQLFLLCNVSLVAAFSYLVVNWKLHVNPLAATFAATGLLSVFLAGNQQDAAMRWVGWFLLYGAVGPLFVNELRLKLVVLDWTRRLLLLLTVGSMVLNLAGVRLSGRGLFFGLMGHTMLLAPVAALAALDLFCSVKSGRSRVHVVLLCICCITCLGTGSRGAVLGLGCGVLTHVIRRRQGMVVVAITALALFALNYVQPSSQNDAVGTNLSSGVYSELMQKGSNNTRDFLWAARVEEFRSSPILGIGFQQQHIYRENVQSLEALEPGSSYLAVLSMTGVVGGIGFLIMLSQAGRSLFSAHSAISSEYRDLLRGWAVFFAVHMVIEGYIFACGSILCFLLWLTFGASISLDEVGKQIRNRRRGSRLLRTRKAGNPVS